MNKDGYEKELLVKFEAQPAWSLLRCLVLQLRVEPVHSRIQFIFFLFYLILPYSLEIYGSNVPFIKVFPYLQQKFSPQVARFM